LKNAKTTKIIFSEKLVIFWQQLLPFSNWWLSAMGRYSCTHAGSPRRCGTTRWIREAIKIRCPRRHEQRWGGPPVV